MTRIITGILLLMIGAFVITNGGLLLYFFLLTVGTLGFYEIHTIVKKTPRYYLILNILAYIIILSLIQFSIHKEWLCYLFLFIIPLFYGTTLLELSNKKLSLNKNKFINNLKHFFYIAFGFSSLLMIRNENDGLLFVIISLIAIWSCDIFALYGGKFFGQRSLTKISPKKTKEGSIIGVLGATLTILIITNIFSLPIWLVFISFVIAILSQFGDIYESLIKRTYNIKDSSNILPGHGGVLDRADSTLYVFPLLLLILKYFVA